LANSHNIIDSAVKELPRCFKVIRLVLEHVDFSHSVQLGHQCPFGVPREIKRLISKLEPHFVADGVNLAERVWQVLWLEAQIHGLRPVIYIRLHVFESCLDSFMYPLTNLELLQLVLASRQVFVHRVEPELHRVVDYLDWAPGNNTGCHGRKVKVFASFYKSIIIETDSFSMDEGSFDQCFSNFTLRFELLLFLLFTRSSTRLSSSRRSGKEPGCAFGDRQRLLLL